MRYLRWATAAVLALYSLWSFLPLGGTAAYKAGLYELPAAQAKYQPLMESTPWLQLALWAAAIGLYLYAAWRLVRGRPAFRVYAAAFVLDVINYAWVRATGVYDDVMAGSITTDYVILVVMLVIGAYLWWSERRGSAHGRPLAA
jgi:hypothetical protein